METEEEYRLFDEYEDWEEEEEDLTCKRCSGTGQEWGTFWDCEGCDGEGYYWWM